MADGSERKDARARADAGSASNRHMTDELDALGKRHGAADMAKRPDPHAVAERSTVLDDRRRMHFRL